MFGRRVAREYRWVPIFEHLPAREIQAFVRAGREVAFPAGAEVMREGDPASGVYLILEGAVIVSAKGREIARVYAGDLFGEIAALDERGRRSATVTAVGDLRALYVPEEDFEDLVKRAPGLSRALLRALAARLRKTSTDDRGRDV